MRLDKLFDQFVPIRFSRGNLTKYRKSRLIVSFSGLAVFWCLVFSTVFTFTIPVPIGAVVSVLGAACFASVPWILQATNPTVAGNFLVLMMFGLVGSVGYTLGGWSGPLLVWYSVMPALATMVTEGRWSVVWAVIVLLQLLGLYTVKLLGWLPIYISETDLDILNCVSIISFMAVLVNLTQLYENFENQTVRKLRRINRELAQARDRALEASKAKTSFVANMSHEFRTPLNAIIGYSDLILDEGSPDEQTSRDLKRIRAAGTHLLELVNGLLDLTKIEAGKMELECQEFSLDPLLEELEDTIQPILQKNGNTFRLEEPAEIPPLYTDALKLKQVLLNLLSNACKFTQNGQVTLRVSYLALEKMEKLIKFEIIDTGIGMTPEQQKKVFEPFTQADASTARRFGGTGLGLTICDRFCRLLGGRLTLQSQMGQGSTFALTIPMKMRAAGPVDI